MKLTVLGEVETLCVCATWPSTSKFTVPGNCGYCGSDNGCVPADTVTVMVQAAPAVQVAVPPLDTLVLLTNTEAIDGGLSLQLCTSSLAVVALVDDEPPGG